MSTLRLLFTRQNRVPERSVEADQVMPLCRFCASSESGMREVWEFCHFSCACEHSLFVALAVHAVNLDDFLCDTWIGEESVSSLAELLFPRSESVVLRHTSVWSDGSCSVLCPRFGRPFNLILARSQHRSLTGFHRSVGVFVEGRCIAWDRGRRIGVVGGTRSVEGSETALTDDVSELGKSDEECGGWTGRDERCGREEASDDGENALRLRENLIHWILSSNGNEDETTRREHQRVDIEIGSEEEAISVDADSSAAQSSNDVQPDCADVVGFRSPPFARPDITTAAFCDSSQIVDDVSSHSTGGNEESVRHAGQWIGCRRVVASGSSFEQHNEILTAVDGRVVWKSNSDESVYPQTLSTRSAAADEPSPIAEEGKSNQIILNSADETSFRDVFILVLIDDNSYSFQQDQ
ncbi:hypothetical protein BLNAU_22132 [Blattamonas nauphoetae]|uniref:Uncharacterized protein n=1 Tax=Blattamonas nauphoetae TaxID=2049346 RepID=A0ABQ9WUG7_9EUKA|nr:hypothetical protein BLNAU_22132 [Blattamonas nauphoetae]